MVQNSSDEPMNGRAIVGAGKAKAVMPSQSSSTMVGRNGSRPFVGSLCETTKLVLLRFKI
jgi:hypothetical protein